MTHTRLFFAAAALASLALAGGPAAAQNYPNKPVTLVVPFSAGGDADQAARNLAVTAQAVLGQPIVVLNKAGANGAIGSIAVKEAAPDGYTLLLARVGSQSLLPALRKDDLKYKWNDFTFIGLLELNPVVCVVHPDSAYKTFGDLTQAIRKNPGKLNYSNSGPATVQNLAPQLLFYKMDMKPDAATGHQLQGRQRGLAGGDDARCRLRLQQPQLHGRPHPEWQVARAGDDHSRAREAAARRAHRARSRLPRPGSRGRLECAVRPGQDGP